MDISHHIENSAAVVTLSSQILGTPADTKIFECRIKDLLVEGVNKVVIDLSEVKRINSTGLAILITGYNLLTGSGGTMVLANPNDFIKGALTITKLNNVFVYFDSVDAAIHEKQ